MPNIVIDLGNTFSKLGIYNGPDLVQPFYGLLDADLLAKLDTNQTDAVLIGSVRRDSSFLDSVLNNVPFKIKLDHQTPLPVKNNYKTPETLGVDRIAGVVGANAMFPGLNCLVIDIGTAITYDFINSSGEYLGGGISPGVEIKLKSLNTFTDNLPLVEQSSDIHLIGRSTEECILSGVIEGTWAEIEGIIARYVEKFEELRVIMCGGGVKLFETKIKETIFVAPELVLNGLNRILEYNVSEES